MSNVQGQIDRINGQVSSQKSLIAQIQTALEGKAAGVKLPTLTNEGAATDLLAGKQLIDGDGNVVRGTMAEVTQATPSISVSSGGLITASATQTAGKVSAGTKSATKQLTTQAAQTITPGTADQTIASGRYLTGTQTIKGDANLVASNIKSGVSIFGVAGSYEGSGGSGGAVETCTVDMCPAMDLELDYICYSDGTAVVTKGGGTLNATTRNTLTVLKHSILFIKCRYVTLSTAAVEGNAIKLYSDDDNLFHVIAIDGDCSIDVEASEPM